MSVMSELAYDIEQMYIEGYSPKTIATMLECPVSIVYDCIEALNMEENLNETVDQGLTYPVDVLYYVQR